MVDLNQYLSAIRSTECFHFIVQENPQIQNNYILDLSAWSVSSPKDNGVEDYYLIRVGGEFASSNGYITEDDMERGFYATEYIVEIIPELVSSDKTWSSLQTSITLIDSEPPTTEEQTSVTASISQSFGANIGFFGAMPMGGFSANNDFSESQTISTPEIKIANLSGTNSQANNAQWKYTMPFVDMDKEKLNHLVPDYVLDPPALMSHSTFTPCHYIKWQVTDRNQATYQSLKLTCNLKVTLTITSIVPEDISTGEAILDFFGRIPPTFRTKHDNKTENFSFKMLIDCPPPPGVVRERSQQPLPSGEMRKQ